MKSGLVSRRDLYRGPGPGVVMIMLAAVLHRDGEPPEPGLHLSPRGRLVNLGSSGGASASSGPATLRSGGLSIPGYANNQPPPRPRRVRQCTIRFCRVPTARNYVQ